MIVSAAAPPVTASIPVNPAEISVPAEPAKPSFVLPVRVTLANVLTRPAKLKSLLPRPPANVPVSRAASLLKKKESSPALPLKFADCAPATLNRSD